MFVNLASLYIYSPEFGYLIFIFLYLHTVDYCLFVCLWSNKSYKKKCSILRYSSFFGIHKSSFNYLSNMPFTTALFISLCKTFNLIYIIFLFMRVNESGQIASFVLIFLLG